MKQFDVLVIGGGHAGAEAAHAAARKGAQVALVTLSSRTIGVMSCNPAIGGLGKGHLVREIDALDGLMGRAADAAGIQFRLLNRRKGPAVQGPRAQADRKLYREAILAEVTAQPNLTVIEGEAEDLIVSFGRVAGLRLADGSELRSRAVVITTGTFLRGVIHVGDRRQEGGRMGDRPSNKLAQRLTDLALPMGRLKTGTPPRLDGRTINWGALEKQPGDENPVMFSYLSTAPCVRQIYCGITHTNEATHDIIRGNLGRSAMYGGHIEATGPRYCPSIEDKVVRFADKTSHQVFLEPEGLDDSTVYPNGISTSMPEEVQLEYVRSISGLEKVEITQPGYAIEYDYVDPRSLRPTLEVRDLPGLFLAGQINGTTGYEEAAAQGLVAGLNAAAQSRAEPDFVLSRSEAYIGVMVDDLVTRGVSEPYRMFTSRAEFRLSLRADNADQRLTRKGIDAECVGPERRMCFENKLHALSAGMDQLLASSYSPQELANNNIKVSLDGTRRTGFDVLSMSEVDFDDVLRLNPELAGISQEIRDQLRRDALYRPYIERQNDDVQALARDEAHGIPADFNYVAVDGLSHELKEKLARVRPATLAHAGRINGMTPAALTLILAKLKRAERTRVADVG